MSYVTRYFPVTVVRVFDGGLGGMRAEISFSPDCEVHIRHAMGRGMVCRLGVSEYEIAPGVQEKINAATERIRRLRDEQRARLVWEQEQLESSCGPTEVAHVHRWGDWQVFMTRAEVRSPTGEMVVGPKFRSVRCCAECGQQEVRL